MPIANAQERKEYRHQYYIKSKHSFYERARKYRELKGDSIRAAKKRFRLKPSGRALYLLEVCRKRAQKKRLPFDLTKEWIQRGIESGCSLSGIDFVLTSGEGHHPYAPSVDREDSSLGYTKLNCRVILWCLNTALGSWGLAASAAAWKATLERVSDAKAQL
jgi:hypothetical protein